MMLFGPLPAGMPRYNYDWSKRPLALLGYFHMEILTVTRLQHSNHFILHEPIRYSVAHAKIGLNNNVCYT